MSDRIRIVAATTLLLVVATALSAGVASAAVEADMSSAVSYQTADNEGHRIDANLSDGDVHWQGQRLGLGNLATAVENAGNMSDVDALHLRHYDADDNELGTLVRPITIESGNQSLDTDGLDGTYVLLPADQRTTVFQFANGSLNGTAAVSAAEPFEVVPQTLSVEWEESPSGAVGSARQIELRSNRLRYNVNVSSPDLSYGELETAFMETRFLRDDNAPFGDRRPFDRRYEMYDVYADSDIIVLRGSEDGALRPNFSSLDRFPELIRVEVTDTGVTDRAVLSKGGAMGNPFNITRLAFTKEVKPGRPVTLQPTIKNEWRQSASKTITFELGQARSTSELTLEGGESRETSTTLPAPTDPGNVVYNVSVEGDSVRGTVVVLNTTSPAGNETKPSEKKSSSSGLLNINLQLGTSHMGGIMTVLSLVTVVLFRRR